MTKNIENNLKAIIDLFITNRNYLEAMISKDREAFQEKLNITTLGLNSLSYERKQGNISKSISLEVKEDIYYSYKGTKVGPNGETLPCDMLVGVIKGESEPKWIYPLDEEILFEYCELAAKSTDHEMKRTILSIRQFLEEVKLENNREQTQVMVRILYANVTGADIFWE
ncbi:MAG: hypothetical protein N4A44_03760 [Alphaproteobacteria bacterium]|jgi:hypothetical protein|nr:hypothetical protein [Alphaproteobacteria bacterium]